MKLEILLFVLAAICLNASAEKLKGRRGQLLNRTEHENVDVKPKTNEKTVRSLKSDPSKGRFFSKKQGNTAPAQPTIILVPAPSTGGGSYTSDPSYYYTSSSTGTSQGTAITSNVPATRKANDNDEDDFTDELDDEYENQAQTGNKKQQKNNLRLKKIKGKKPSVRYVVPARYVHNIENNGPVGPVSNSGNFKNGGNKFIRLRMDDNANNKKKSENIRILVQKP